MLMSVACQLAGKLGQEGAATRRTNLTYFILSFNCCGWAWVTSFGWSLWLLCSLWSWQHCQYKADTCRKVKPTTVVPMHPLVDMCRL